MSNPRSNIKFGLDLTAKNIVVFLKLIPTVSCQIQGPRLNMALIQWLGSDSNGYLNIQWSDFIQIWSNDKMNYNAKMSIQRLFWPNFYFLFFFINTSFSNHFTLNSIESILVSYCSNFIYDYSQNFINLVFKWCINSKSRSTNYFKVSGMYLIQFKLCN